MPRSDRRWRGRASADPYFHQISASCIDGASESSPSQNESGGDGPSNVECRRYESFGFLRVEPWGSIGLLCRDVIRFWLVLTRTDERRVRRGNDIQSARLRRLPRGQWRRRHSGSPRACGHNPHSCASDHNAAASHGGHATRWNAAAILDRR
jgi:hypothetical protein